MNATAPKRTSFGTILWVCTTYFAEGLPYMMVRVISGVYFTEAGVKERYLGFLNLLGIPWTAKPVWAPLVDVVGTKRRWMAGTQLVIALLAFAIAGACFQASTSEDAAPYLTAIAVFFGLMAFAGATNDVAIDGYYLEALTDKADQAAYSGHRVMAYRLSTVFARSGLVSIAALVAARGAAVQLQWTWAWGAAAGVLALLAIGHALFVPRVEAARTSKAQTGSFLTAYTSFLAQEKIAIVLIFIVAYKLGDEMLLSMMNPFLLRELGITKEQYSWVTGIVGAFTGVFGAYVAQFWVKAQGLRRSLLPIMLLMNVNILAYAALAEFKPDPKTPEGIAAIATVYGFEQAVLNLGLAALVLFLMRKCKPEFKAAHYAIGSGFSAIGSLFGSFGGVVVEAAGYRNLFLLAFAISVPAMLMLRWVPLGDDPV